MENLLWLWAKKVHIAFIGECKLLRTDYQKLPVLSFHVTLPNLYGLFIFTSLIN